MTEAMIDRLRELLRAGSPLPWRSVPVRESEGSFVVLWHEVHDANDRMLPDGEPDASLIVEAVNRLPELLDARDRMAGALREIAEQCEMAIDEIDRLDLMTDGAKALREASRRIAGQCRAALAVPKEENPDA